MVRALVAFVIVVGACTTEASEEGQPQEPAPVAKQPERVAQQPAQIAQPPDRAAAIDACRKACWADIPVDGCKAQRDACFKRATKRDDKLAAEKATPDKLAADKLAVDKLHCREMGQQCRQIRHDCLAACDAPAVTK
jgi:hypothetical protein